MFDTKQIWIELMKLLYILPNLYNVLFMAYWHLCGDHKSILLNILWSGNISSMVCIMNLVEDCTFIASAYWWLTKRQREEAGFFSFFLFFTFYIAAVGEILPTGANSDFTTLPPVSRSRRPFITMSVKYDFHKW